MKLEVGKLYRTRDGKKVRIYATDVEGELPIHGAVYRPEYNRWDVNAWRENGIDEDYVSNFDIIGEWEKSLNFDPDCLPAWAKFIAMDMSGKWYYYNQKPYLELDLPFFSKHQGSYVDNLFCGEIPIEYAPQNFNKDWKESIIEVNYP